MVERGQQEHARDSSTRRLLALPVSQLPRACPRDSSNTASTVGGHDRPTPVCRAFAVCTQRIKRQAQLHYRCSLRIARVACTLHCGQGRIHPVWCQNLQRTCFEGVPYRRVEYHVCRDVEEDLEGKLDPRAKKNDIGTERQLNASMHLKRRKTFLVLSLLVFPATGI